MKEFGNIVYGADVKLAQSDQSDESKPVVYATRFGNFLIFVQRDNTENKLVIQTLRGFGAVFYTKNSPEQSPVLPGQIAETTLGSQTILINGNDKEKVIYESKDLT